MEVNHRLWQLQRGARLANWQVGMVCETIASLLERKEYMLHTVRNSKDAFWMKLGAEKRLAASAKRSLIPSAFNLLAPILSMHYRRDGFLGTY